MDTYLHDPYIKPLVQAFATIFAYSQEKSTADAYCEAYNTLNATLTAEELDENRNLYIQRALFLILAIFSITGLSIVALTIFYNDKLNQHPSPLIARICLVEAIMCWNALMR